MQLMSTEALPERMTAIGISEPGGPDVLRPVSIDVPNPGAEEVLLRVIAAGVNRPDCLQRRGLYPPPPGASEIPGLEVAGTVVFAGDDVDQPRVGDEVCALLAGGGYAQYASVPAIQCLPIPSGMEPIEAAAIPETFFTVWTNLFDRGRLDAGESVLIHGGASGIGTTAIQLAIAFGARVFATAGTDEKTRLAEQLGAECVVNYRTEDFVEVIRAKTGGPGVDVILDIVGARYLKQNVELLNADGRLVIIGLLGGGTAEMNLAPLLTKRLTLTGSTLRSRPSGEKAAIAADLKEKVWPLLESGKVRPVIQRTFPLEQAAEAHRLLEENGSMGKLVLTAELDE